MKVSIFALCVSSTIALLRGIDQSTLSAESMPGFDNVEDAVTSNVISKPSMENIADEKLKETKMSSRSKETLKTIDAFMKSSGVMGMKKMDVIDEVTSMIGGEDKSMVIAMENTLERWRKMYDEGVHKKKAPSISDIQSFYQGAQTEMFEIAKNSSPEEKKLLDHQFDGLISQVTSLQEAQQFASNPARKLEPIMKLSKENKSSSLLNGPTGNSILFDKLNLPEGAIGGKEYITDGSIIPPLGSKDE